VSPEIVPKHATTSMYTASSVLYIDVQMITRREVAHSQYIQEEAH
jgi:hypothetical protein